MTNSTRRRVIAPSWYPVCTIAYAVTRRGAEKLLYHIGGYNGIGSPVDLAMIDAVQNGKVKSYTVVPPLFNPFKTGGEKDSDIDKEFNDGSYENGNTETGQSENLRQSVRAAMKAEWN